jgi:transcriptional regulator GlxA family with amidase domain
MTRRSVAIIIHDGVQALDVAVLLEVLAEANRLLGAGEGYHATLIASEVRAFRTSNGMAIVADQDFASAATIFDIAVVADGPELIDLPFDAAIPTWLGDWGAKAGRLGSIGLGAFALGQAGLLAGRMTTTDRRNAARLAARFPTARVADESTVVRDGRLISAAGAGAAVELALAVVSEDHGPEIALACAEKIAGTGPPSSQRVGLGAPTTAPPTPSTALARILDYIPAHLSEPLSVERLASVAAMSARSLARLFSSELRTTPHEFVESHRVDFARRLLGSSDLGLKVVAHRCGFGGAEQMRVIFQKRLGISPTAFRDQARSANERKGPDTAGSVAPGVASARSSGRRAPRSPQHAVQRESGRLLRVG